MKKTVFLSVLLAAVAFIFTSCSDSDPLPNVSLTVDIDGGTVDTTHGIVYVLQGDTLNVLSVSATNLDTKEPATITGVDYFLNYSWVGNTTIRPFSMPAIINENTRPGDYVLNVSAGIAVVDKEFATVVAGYQIKVVSDVNDIPAVGVTKSLSAKANYKND